MKRSDYPKPFTTCMVDLNSTAAYAAQGLAPRKYPRLLPIPYHTVSEQENRLVLEPWRKNLQLYPQLFFLTSRDVEARSGEALADAVLGLGLGLAFSDDGVVQASPDPAPRDQLMCYWYSLYSDNAQVLAQNMVPGLDARELQITIESPTLGRHVFDQRALQFDPVQLLEEMNILIAYRAYDLFALGAADAPLRVPTEQRFLPGEVITISCPQLGTMEISVDDRRDPDVRIAGWKPRAYFLEPEYAG